MELWECRGLFWQWNSKGLEFLDKKGEAIQPTYRMLWLVVVGEHSRGCQRGWRGP